MVAACAAKASEMTEPDDRIQRVKVGRGVPAPVQLEVKAAIKIHFKQHGRRKRRSLLREDPRFSPWIGYDVGKNGQTGKKALDRLVAEVDQEVAAARRRGPLSLIVSSVSSVAPEGEGPEDTLAQVMAGGAPALSFAELQDDLRSDRALIKQAMQDCADGELLIKLSRECRAIARDSAALLATFNAAMKSQKLQKRLLAAAFESHAGDGERAAALADAFDQIFIEFTGLSATGGVK